MSLADQTVDNPSDDNPIFSEDKESERKRLIWDGENGINEEFGREKVISE